MTEFKVGDKVRVKSEDQVLPKGATGTVASVTPGLWLDIEWLDTREASYLRSGGWSEKRFEFVECDSEPEREAFSLGDRVKAIAESWDDVPIGSIGTVIDCPNHPSVLNVRFDGIKGDDDDYESGWAMFPTQLERIAESRSEGRMDQVSMVAPDGREVAASAPFTVSKGRVYVSGPMTGYEDFNFPAFNEAADALRAQGYMVENPADKGIIDGWEWSDYMRYDVAKLSECDYIYTLSGWEFSKGARLEMNLADALGIEWLNPDNAEMQGAVESMVAEKLSGEVRETSSTGGQKGSKPERYDLIPWDAMDAVARVYAFGAEKYADHNWRKGYDWKLSIASVFRHIAAFAMGEDYDPESGQPHPAHAVFHMLTLIAWLQDSERYGQFDTRYKPSDA